MNINPQIATEILNAANNMNILKGSADEVAEGIAKVSKETATAFSAADTVVTTANTAAQTAQAAATTASATAATADTASTTANTAATAANTAATTENAAAQTAQAVATKASGGAFTGLGRVIKGAASSALSFAVANPMLAGITAIAAAIPIAMIAIEKFTVSYEEAQEQAQNSAQAYAQTKSELESLRSEYDQTIGRIRELQELKDAGTITLSEESELEGLKQQTTELQTQLDIKERLAELEQQQASKDAETALTKADESVASMYDENGNKYSEGSKAWDANVQGGTDAENLKANIKRIKEFEKSVQELQNKQKSAKSKSEFDDYQKEIDTLQEAIVDLEEDSATRASNIASNLENISDKTSDVYRENKEALEAYTNIDLSPAEQKLSAIESFFEDSSSSFLKDELLEMAKQSELTAEDIERMGIALDGVSAEEVAGYFNDMAKSAQEASEAINSIDGSVEGVKSAFESENQDADWNAMSDYLSQANELYKSGKIGTDDFKSAVQFISPKLIDPDDGKYDADAYVEIWEKAQSKIKRYFDQDNPIKSVNNLLNDLESKGFAKQVGDEFEWTDKFKSSAEAADELGLSVYAVETLMHNLEAYGAEFDNVVFSGEGLDRYETALDGIKTLYDSMDEGVEKQRIGNLIDGWDEELGKYQDDLSLLTEDQIVKIEFEYDLATLREQISDLEATAQDSGNANDYAKANSARRKYIEEYISGLQEQGRLNDGDIEKVSSYGSTDKTISALQDKLVTADSNEEKVDIQLQISNLRDLQDDLLSAFDDSGLSWDQFLNTDEAKNVLSQISRETEWLNDEYSLDIDLDTMKAQEQINGIISNDGKTIIMDVTASTEEVEYALSTLEKGQTILFTADVGGVEKKISAIKNEDGTITYTIVDTGEEVNFDKEAGVYYKTTGQDDPSDENAGVGYIKISQEGPSNDHASVSYLLGSQEAPKPKTARVNYVIGSVQGVGSAYKKMAGGSGVNGTAHAYGTVRKGSAFATGNWGASKTEKALVGELGRETIVRNGHFFTVGDNGAEFVNIRKDDVIFNHKQTEELFNNGYVTSGGGRAKVAGGAFASGTAYANGIRWPAGGANKTSSGSGSKSSSSSSSKKSSSSSSSKSSSKKSSSNSSSKADEKFEEKIDEIEILLDRMDRAIQRLTDSIETYSYSLSKQSSVADQAMNKIRNSLPTLQKAYNRYIKEANSVGLSSSWKKKVQNGAVNIETVKDEKLADKISEYQKWYEKALDVQDTIADMQQELLDLAVEKLDNIEQYFENRTNYNDEYGYLTSLTTLQDAVNKLTKELNKQVSNGVIKEFSNEWYSAMSQINSAQEKLFAATIKKYQDIIDNLSRISDTLDNSEALKDARDETVPESDYKRQIEVNNESIQEMYNKRQKLVKQQAIYDVGSEKYDDLADQIADIDDDIYGLLTDIEELKDKIWEVRWKPFFDGQEALADLVDETDEFRNLLNSDAFVSETGGLTADGITNLALISQSMNAAKQSIRNYQEAIKKLDEDLQNGNISTKEYEEQQKDFLEQIRNSVGVVEDYRNEIIDLWKTQLEAENDVIQESIDKHEELLDAKKANDEYSRNVRNQTKDINALQAQISALSGVKLFALSILIAGIS